MTEFHPTILFENDDLLVINKPAGLVVHPDGKREGESLVNWILNNYPEMSGVGEPLVMEHKGETVTIDRPGIVHRLDRETSGVLILAKNQKSYEHLKKQFQDHSVHKEYLAIVLGNTNDRGIIDEAIGRNSRDIRIWSIGRNIRGMMRAAITRYFTERKFEIDGEKFSVVRLFPETGRTHQLRVHMKSIQHPIIGDGLYSPKTLGMLGFDRTALHAHKITFTDLQGIQHSIEAPLPDDFKRVIS
jgi:23S rRNA pseudouridine1911/1915/1917 synthase